MKYDPDKHYRRSIRLPGYDYSQPGAYFITICTQGRICLLGDVADGVMVLNDAGRIVANCWKAVPCHFKWVELDEFVVMPNHLHGIINIVDAGRGTACRAPTPGEQFGRPQADSLTTVIRSFKSAATNSINLARNSQGQRVWQRNYYEHVIRNDSDLNRIRHYISENPAKWSEDPDNPGNIKCPPA